MTISVWTLIKAGFALLAIVMLVELGAGTTAFLLFVAGTGLGLTCGLSDK